MKRVSLVFISVVPLAQSMPFLISYSMTSRSGLAVQVIIDFVLSAGSVVIIKFAGAVGFIEMRISKSVGLALCFPAFDIALIQNLYVFSTVVVAS